MRIILMILRALRWGSTFVGLGTISLASARFLRRRQQNRLVPRNHDSTFVIRGQASVARTKLIKTKTRPVRGSCFSVLICVYPCPSVVPFLLSAWQGCMSNFELLIQSRPLQSASKWRGGFPWLSLRAHADDENFTCFADNADVSAAVHSIAAKVAQSPETYQKFVFRLH